MKIFLPLFLILVIFVVMITNCSSSEKSSEESYEKIEPAPPPLSPGTASVEAEIISVSETDGKCKIKIINILGYGSATPVLAQDIELETTLVKTIKEKNNIEKGKVYKLLLRSMEMKGEKPTNWQISKINQ